MPTSGEHALPSITLLGHSTVLVEFGSIRLLTDPVLRGHVVHLNRVVPKVPRDVWRDVDVVVLSHLHHDHCDIPTLKRLGRKTPLIVPVGAGYFLSRLNFTDVTELVVGTTLEHRGVTITATPAVHDGKRKPFGPTAAAVGYLMVHGDGPDEASVYFAGDTDLWPGMADVHPRLDVALVPVWGWGDHVGPGHLSPREAARAVALLRPRYAVPIHWGTLYPFGMKRFADGLLEHPPLAFERAVQHLRLPTEVLVTPPGTQVAFPP